jgi:hypothetical protein
VAGSATGDITVGTTVLPGDGVHHSVFVVRYDGTGAVKWRKRFDNGGEQRVAGVAFGAGGDPVLAVNFTSALDFGPGCTGPSLDGGAGHGALVALALADGACTASIDALKAPVTFAGLSVAPGTHEIYTVGNTLLSVSIARYPATGWTGANFAGLTSTTSPLAVAALGAVAIIAGGFSGALQGYQSPVQLVSSGNTTDIFAARIADDAGAYTAAVTDGVALGDGTADQHANAVATDGTDVFLAGELSGTLGDGGASVSAGGKDAFVLRRHADLSPVWDRSFGGGSDEWATAVAAAGGRVVVAGEHYGAFELVTPLPAYGQRDVFVAALAAADGAPQWSCSFGGAANDDVTAVAASAGGDVVIAGRFSGKAAFGQALEGAGGAVFVVRLTGNP